MTLNVRQWLGVYNGVVVRNDDPQGQNRVTLKVPQVLGTAVSQWAAPAGANPGEPPDIGQTVLVQFIGGDINHPVYLLGFDATTGNGGYTSSNVVLNSDGLFLYT